MTRPASSRPSRGILILDMSYTLKMFRERQLGQALESRKLNGYFDRIISVHPLAALFETGPARYGKPTVTTLDESHVFVEGKLGLAPMPVVLAPFNFVLAQVGLVRLLLRMARESRTSVVRVGDPYYLGVMGWTLARLLGVPLVVRVPFRYDEIRRITGRAAMPRLLRFGWIEKRLERFIFPRCDLIAGANEDNMRYALENGGRPEVATVFRYGNLLHPSHWVEPGQRPDPARELSALGLAGTRFVATVARLEAEKRVGDAIRVVAELAKRGCDVSGLIIGDGSLRPQLAELAQDLGVGNRIVFAGTRPQEWISTVLPHAAVIVSPHMGRALVEAALSAVPIVAYDYDWQREVAIDGETGYLVKNGDWREMADRTEALLADPQFAHKLGTQARALASRMMDPASLEAHEQATYSALLTQWAALGTWTGLPNRQAASSRGPCSTPFAK